MDLSFDLIAIDGKLLFRAEQKITLQKLVTIRRQAPAARPVPLSDSLVLADLEHSFKHPRYQTIFSPPEFNAEILQTMRQVAFPEMIFREFKKMKRVMPYTYRHILRTSILSTKLSLDEQIRKDFKSALMAESSLMHDLGKSRIPVRILNKVSPLTPEEYAIMKSHPLTGFVLLHYYFGPGHRIVEDPSFEHHERLDGTGYPRRVRKMNKYSQVIAVADVFDAILSSRPYRREPFTMRAALDHLLDEARGGRLNPVFVLLLISYARKSKPALRDLRIAGKKRDAPPRRNMYGKIKSH